MRWTAGGIALLVLGLLILIPSGLCTASLGIAAFMIFLGLVYVVPGGGFAWEVLLMGGIATAIGAGLVYAALKLRRRD